MSILAFDKTVVVAGTRLSYSRDATAQAGDILHQKDHQTREAYDAVLRDRCPRSVLEVGVYNGGSLAMWRHLWPDARIVGVDVTMERVHPAVPALAELYTHKMPDEAVAKLGQFDLVIDDGGHGAELVLSTFSIVWPMVSPGGMYVCEDWHRGEFDPIRIAGTLGATAIGTDDGAYFCDGPLPSDAAARVDIYRRVIVVHKHV